MEAGDWATWIGSAAAVLAAAASIAVWARERTNVVWEFRRAKRDPPTEEERAALANVGSATAKDVQVYVIATRQDRDIVEEQERAARVAPNEVIRVMADPTYGISAYFVKVTWRGPFGKRRNWIYHIV